MWKQYHHHRRAAVAAAGWYESGRGNFIKSSVMFILYFPLLRLRLSNVIIIAQSNVRYSAGSCIIIIITVIVDGTGVFVETTANYQLGFAVCLGC